MTPSPEAPSDAPAAEPHGFDPTVPNAARIYDWLIGGKDNYEADRQAGQRLEDALPGIRRAARDNRAWLGRAVYRIAEARVTQFLDIGSGLPAAGPVHEIAAKVCPDARVAYVDHDPVVVTHARALLSDAPGLTAVQADLREPEALLDHPGLGAVIDFSQPVGVLLVAVLHFLEDGDDPHQIVSALASRLAPGSFIAISHGTTDGVDAAAAAAAKTAYQGASMPGVPRSRAEVERFFDGLELLPPGVEDIRAWGRPGVRPSGPVLFWAAVGRVP